MAGEKAVQPVGDACGGEDGGGGEVDGVWGEPVGGEVKQGGEDGDKQYARPCETDGKVKWHRVSLWCFQAAFWGEAA